MYNIKMGIPNIPSTDMSNIRIVRSLGPEIRCVTNFQNQKGYSSAYNE